MRPLKIAKTRRTRETLETHGIVQEQWKHFVWVDMLPTAASLVSVWALYRLGTQMSDWAVFFLTWAITALGIEVGYHRYFSHAAFTARNKVRAALLIFGAMGGQGPVISWVSNHRYHHRYSDSEKDSHSPHGRQMPAWLGLAHAHVLWKRRYALPNPSVYADRLLRDPLIKRLDRHYYNWVLLGIFAPGVLGGLLSWSWRGALVSFLLAGVVRLTLIQQTTYAVNSLCHFFGSRPYSTRDQSRNLFPLSFLSVGGAWHNNHHAYPSSATNQHRWWQLDPGYWFIRGMEAVGLVQNVKKHPMEKHLRIAP